VVEAGAEVLREHCDLDWYWSRCMAREVFAAMTAKRKQSGL
jgi:hypothetical protein